MDEAMSPLVTAAAALVALLVGLSKAGVGGAVGSISTPIMALVLPAEQAVGVMLPILIVGDAFALAAHWRQWRGRLVLLLLPGAVAGVTAGTLLITNAPTGSLRIVIGLIVLIFALYKALERWGRDGRRYRPRDWHGWLAGAIAGFSSSLAHSGGPPIGAYLLLQELPPRVYVATAVLFFAVINIIKVPYYAYAGLFDLEQQLALIWMLPLVPIGAWLGRNLVLRASGEGFQRAVIVLLIVSGLLLVFG